MPTIEFDSQEVQNNLETFFVKFQEARRRAAEQIASVLEEYAKLHHGDTFRPARMIYPPMKTKAQSGAGGFGWTTTPFFRPSGRGWGNVTGRTQATTYGSITRETRNFVEIALSAGMSYDVFLETAHNLRWSWLWPALVNNQDTIMEILTVSMELM